ncbi:hypothetical protein ACH4Q7_22790 [Streptomyces roseolus]|uniref:hypothetical protein n=1 Tax=Streptomyces roseolus TaxID=67358 RepID=UPI0037992F6B
MKMPKVVCEKCQRPIAAGPVAGRLSKGRLWRHDPPAERRDPEDRLVSCAGSLEIVDLPYGQMELDVELEPEVTEQQEAALF